MRLDGHAIEARVYAESPERGFLPATGDVLAWRVADGRAHGCGDRDRIGHHRRLRPDDREGDRVGRRSFRGARATRRSARRHRRARRRHQHRVPADPGRGSRGGRRGPGHGSHRPDAAVRRRAPFGGRDAGGSRVCRCARPEKPAPDRDITRRGGFRPRSGFSALGPGGERVVASPVGMARRLRRRGRGRTVRGRARRDRRRDDARPLGRAARGRIAHGERSRGDGGAKRPTGCCGCTSTEPPSTLRPLSRREAMELRLARRDRESAATDPQLRAPMPGAVVAVHVADGASVARRRPDRHDRGDEDGASRRRAARRHRAHSTSRSASRCAATSHSRTSSPLNRPRGRIRCDRSIRNPILNPRGHMDTYDLTDDERELAAHGARVRRRGRRAALVRGRPHAHAAARRRGADGRARPVRTAVPRGVRRARAATTSRCAWRSRRSDGSTSRSRSRSKPA